MVNDKYDVRWSPFDPNWYQAAFDKFINTADMLFSQDFIISQGYVLPDADGSRSSVFRNEAVLNNSFNEIDLRNALRDIYLNNSNRLVAANHDNVHFFQWIGTMSDMEIIPNTNYCQFVIPAENFIYPGERDQFKLSQYYRKWIKVEDILNHWDVFKWHCMLFIDQRIYSEYELRIDDHEITIRFKYYEFWMKQNYPVYIYKFDTNASTRIFISKELCINQWKWEVPTSYLTDKRVLNSNKLMVAFNRISDPSIRTTDASGVEVLGDNLEFVDVKDGYIDISKISKFNRTYIMSEEHEWIWMSIIVPKFFHEYPIVLPTDVVYQPYEANFQPVVTVNYDMIQKVKNRIDYNQDYQQVYVDLNGELKSQHNSWKQLIRPIVLSDAFDGNYVEPNDRLLKDVNKLRDLTVECANVIDLFRSFTKDYTSDDIFKNHCTILRNIVNATRDQMHIFLDTLYAEYDTDYELLYKRFLTLMDEIDEVGITHELFHHVTEYEREDRDFWTIISPLVWIPRRLADQYYVVNVIHHMSDRANLWQDRKEFLNQVRYQRPIDETDFWTFEYDADNEVWRPYPLAITRHFPDVYIPRDSADGKDLLNRVFKAFFFYSDTMNVLNPASKISRPTTSWDEDVESYHVDQAAVYRDIFMEKFYWMGMRSIYKGILVTQNRWEVIEYVIDNESYERFNQLFLKTMDPYFKLGLTTYLRSPNFEFPFDDAIAKMEESMDNDFIGYKKITNFEVYLNKTWIPSYFDHITTIMDDWDYSNRLVRRPRSTFDLNRLLPIMVSAQDEVFDSTRKLVNLIHWIVEHLQEESYKMNVDNIKELETFIDDMYDNIFTAYESTKNLDMHIYSVDDINFIAGKLRKYLDYQKLIDQRFDDIYEDVRVNNVHATKRDILDEIDSHVGTIKDHIKNIASIVNDFDFDLFMSVINDLRTYFYVNKDNPDDESLLGHINQFNDAWTEWVKTKRTKLFTSSNELSAFYDPEKLYENEDIEKMMNIVDAVGSDLTDLRQTIDEFYEGFGYKQDETLYNKFDRTSYLLATLNLKLDEFLTARGKLVDEYEAVLELIDKMSDYINPTETGFIDAIKENFFNIIRHLSYIAGVNRRDAAEETLVELKKDIQLWYRYLDTEKEIFDNLEILANPPIEIIMVLEKYHDIILSIIGYMDSVNTTYIPDGEWPTYSDIYRVTKVAVVDQGFEHETEDFIFAPNLGTYQVESVYGLNRQVDSIVDTNYRNTTFRNPMTQYRPYDTITNGSGVGITLKPVEIEHKTIVNDHVVESILIRISSAVEMIHKDVATYNPVNNTDLKYALSDIERIKSSWDNLIDRFWEYMTPAVKTYVNRLVDFVTAFIDPCNKFIDARERIQLSKLIKLYQDYIYDSFTCAKDMNLQTDTFFYYYEIIRVSYNELCDFYGSGTSWKDGSELKALLIDTARPIRFYWKKVFESVAGDDRAKYICGLKEDLTNLIRDMVTAIDEIPTQVIDLNGMIHRLTVGLDNVPDLTKDLWYKFKSSSVAVEGMEYRIGDIVEIIPTDEDVSDMDPLTVSDIKLLWHPCIEPDDYDKDAHNVTGVRQVNEPETDILWDDGFVDENNPGNQRIQLVKLKPKEVVKLWNGEIVSEECTDTTIDENSDEVILLQVTDVDEFGRVRSVKPMMNYAIPYRLWGVRKTRTRVGQGYGLQIDCFSTEIQLEDSTLLNDSESSIDKQPVFDENDMVKFRFENIHDLDIRYEVFIGGRQISNFVIRHEDTDDYRHPKKIDVLYLNANDVINLQNSSIYIPAEHYFIYRIDDITIDDPGTGYSLGQNIIVDANGVPLKLNVDVLDGSPLKGIGQATLTDGSLLYEKVDPGRIGANVVTDSLNNIDDEFNVGYYDKLTAAGVIKPLTKSLDPDEYSYRVKRHDELQGDDRNEIFMYPSVDRKAEYPDNGDPDYHWYQGSRIDNSYVEESVADMVQLTVDELDGLWNFDNEPDYDHDALNKTGVRNINNPETHDVWNDYCVSENNPGTQLIGLTKMTESEINALWNGESIYEDDSTISDLGYDEADLQVWNGIFNVVPPTDPFIPDAQRTPISQPVKGEYQMVASMRIHNSCDPGEFVELVLLTVNELDNLWNFDREPDDYDKDAHNVTGVRQVNEPETDILWDDGFVDENNPGNQRIRLKTISPLEVFMIWRGEEIREEDDDDSLDGQLITDVTSVFNFRVDAFENACMITGDMTVESFADLPRHKEDFPDGGVGKIVIVEHDETNYGHRMLYRIRTFIAAGFFVYDLPEVADYEWNEFNVNWMNSDWIADFPTMIAQYPDAPWETSPSYRKVMHKILDKKVDNTYVPELVNNSSFIANLTVDDISVYNWSLHQWEDLHDASRWELITRHNDETQDWGFTLRFLEPGNYSYDMRLYLNKTPYTQQKNAEFKRNAKITISTAIQSEVDKAAINMAVDTGRHLRIRKLFPYEQKESYQIGFDADGGSLGYKMDFKLAQYMHYKNQIHLEDIVIYNRSAGRFEDVLDTSKFEVQFKDPRAVTRGFETQTRIVQTLISSAGQGFINGTAWAWNYEYGIIVFGKVTSDFLTDGHMLTFVPTHCPNPPKTNISLEFKVFQHDTQSDVQKGVVVMEFVTERVEMYGDGYIHNVTNPLAPVPEEFRVIVLYDLDGVGEYDIIINNNPNSWTFIEPIWMTLPTFHIDDRQVASDKVYMLTDKGRMPLVNPSTNKPTLHITKVATGTDVTFMNLYRRFTKMDIHVVPYSMRSVYVQRRIPKNGYIDLSGKINKPLNKKYFEFWVNGKLLHDEVTIISPTKIFLHGLKSLKNLEIVEINRDTNEYFSDSFLEVDDTSSRPYYGWNYTTYLDDALSGNLKDDNYTTEEQEYLLSPVWPQVESDHPEYKNYPPNVDIEDDILLMISSADEDVDDEIDSPIYQYLVIDPPTLEGKPIFEQGLTLEHFGLSAITDEMIVDMLNEEWEHEIKTDPYFNKHVIISDDEWYGTTARLYDEYGIRVHTLNEAVYNVHSDNVLRINTKTKSNKIEKNYVEYDLD